MNSTHICTTLLLATLLGYGGDTNAADGGTAITSDLNQWDETTTWSEFNSALELVWANDGGDWLDANGEEQGHLPFAAVDVVDDDAPGSVEMDVTALLQATGEANFFIRRKGGTNYIFHSRETGKTGPTLLINGSIVVRASADSSLNGSTVRSLGTRDTLTTQSGFLVRFELATDERVSSAVLRLQSTGAEYGNQTLELYQPKPTLRTIARPRWLETDPTVIANFTAEDILKDRDPVTVDGDIATARLIAPKRVWINANMVIPNQTQACATIYERLGEDFRPGDGGKHPGFSNTGDSIPGHDVVNGVSYSNSGWGGRAPDGIHWSARTGYGTWNESHVGSHTYFYAMDPHDRYGWAEPIGYPFPKGKWSAYVQCLKLNTVSGSTGNNDGKLYYEVAGVGPVYSRENIRWRDIDVPESEIREFWINYYCGGTSCGDIENRGTIDFAGAVITRGLPDMSAVEAEVDRLNRNHP